MFTQKRPLEEITFINLLLRSTACTKCFATQIFPNNQKSWNLVQIHNQRCPCQKGKCKTPSPLEKSQNVS